MTAMWLNEELFYTAAARLGQEPTMEPDGRLVLVDGDVEYVSVQPVEGVA